MESVDDILGGTGATVVLADQEGRILRSAEDGTRVAQMLRRRGISEGADLSEDSCGNNGIGTVLETRAGVRIAGEQAKVPFWEHIGDGGPGAVGR